jgi:MFS family permease
VGRPILPQFHAAFSIGTVAGSLAGAGAAALAVPVPAQLVAMAVLAVGWRWWATPLLLPDERGVRRAAPARAPAGPARRPVPAPSRGRRLARPDARALLVGVVALAASASELGANDWLALGVVDGFGAGQSTAAVTFGVFVGAMTLVRLVGTPVLARFGRVAVLRASAALAIVGIVVFVTAPSLPVAVAGVAAWGAGSALNFPIAISAASDEPRRAALRVATLSAFAAGAGLVGPLVIGALGEQVGVRSAVLVIAIVLGTVLLVAGRAARVEPERVEPGRGEPERVELEATVAPEPAPAVTGRRAEVALAVGHAA